MHIFLTGNIQVGKSTVILKTLSMLGIIPGGFRTYFGPDRKSPNRGLYINSASDAQLYREENVVAKFTENNPPQVFVDKFDTLGVELIRSARTTANFIVMDECGNLEKNALLFQRELLDALNGIIPILGVIKLSGNGWVDKIRNHPNVSVITVSEKNRDTLPSMLTRQFFKNI